MKLQLAAIFVCMLVFAQFANAETQSNIDPAKSKDTATTAETNPVDSQKKDTTAGTVSPIPKTPKSKETTAGTVSPAPKSTDKIAPEKEKIIIEIKNGNASDNDKRKEQWTVATELKDKDKDKDKDKVVKTVAPSRITDVKNNKPTPNIETVNNPQIQKKSNYRTYTTTYDKNGSVTYQNNTDNQYAPAQKAKKYQGNAHRLEDLLPNNNIDDSAGYPGKNVEDPAAQAKYNKLYADDKKIAADWLATAGNQFPATRPFSMARIKFVPDVIRNDPWNSYPEADRMALEHVKKDTPVNVSPAWNTADLKKLDEMVKYPVLFITANGEFNPSASDQENLKKYLLQGGFVYADDCVDDFEGDGFFKSFKAAAERAFGTEMVKLPDTHAIYHCFHDLPSGAPNPHPKCQKYGGWGLYLNGRLVAFLTSGDIHCGWKSRLLRMNGGKPWYSYRNETLSLKMGVNIIVYALSHQKAQK